MSNIILWKYCAWLALFSSPAVPLFFAWRLLLRSERSNRLGTLILVVIASLSLIWFVAATMNYRFTGPLSGTLHYFITAGNLIAAIVCAVFCLVTSYRRGQRAARLLTCLACLMLAVEWTLLGIAYR
ncbi:MAG TPA: hypothetical protein VHD85_22855 [Terracidiphilus sp.]|nr:hypothetical protein [Terracidiphilus sp.]